MIEICRVYAYCKDDDLSLIENYGKHLSDETKIKMSESRKSVKN